MFVNRRPQKNPRAGTALAAFLLAGFAGAMGWCQNPAHSAASKTTVLGTPPTPTTDASCKGSAGYSPFLPVAGNRDSDAARRQILVSAATRKKNAADADRLVALAQELSSISEAPNRVAPSAEEVKKVEEIEKLARRVKERLAGP
jgi:hypothetical protein